MVEPETRGISVVCVDADDDGATSLRDALDGAGDLSVRAEADRESVRHSVSEGSVDCVVAGAGLADDAGVSYLGDLSEETATVLLARSLDDVAVAAARAGVDTSLPRSALQSDPAVVADAVRELVAKRERRRVADRFRTVAEHAQEVIFVTRGIVVPGTDDADGSNDAAAPATDGGTSAGTGAGAAGVGPEALYMSPAYEDVYGRPVEEVYESPGVLYEAVHPDDRLEYRAHLERMVADAERDETRESYSFTFRIVRPDGEVRWLDATVSPASPETDGEGEALRRWVGVSRDVTERRRLQQDLLERERTLRDVFRSVSDGLVVHDPETGEIIDVNDRFCEMNGYDRETLVGADVGTVTAEGFDYEAAKRKVQRAREEGPQLFEWRNERADGTEFPVEVSLSVARIGGEDRVLASVRDVSERRRLQAELERRERRFSEIANHIDEVIYLAERDFSEILYTNPAYEEVYGRPVEDLYEDPWAFLEAVHPEDRAAYRADLESMVADAEAGDCDDAYEFEHRLARDDEVRWVRVTAYPSRDEDGTVDHFVGVVEDVTRRRRRRREYEQIFDGVNDMIAVHDPAAEEMVDVNETFCEVTGYDEETALDLDVGGLSVSEEGFTHERGYEVLRTVAETGDPERLEWLLETSDGERRWFEVSATPARINGEQRVLGISRDVTERKRRERELEETERRFERITENVDEVIFNTYGVASIAEEVYDDPPPEVGLDYVNPAFEEVWGRPVEAVRDDPQVLYEGVVPEDREEFRAAAERMATDARADDTDDAYATDFRVRRPDGSVRWVTASAYPVPIRDSPLYYWVGVFEDVTEERRRQRYLEQIAAGIDEVIYLSSPDMEDVLYLSPGYEEIWGRPAEAVYEDPFAFMEGIHPDDEEWFREAVDEMRTDLSDPDRDHDDVYTFEYRVVRPDGDVRWVETVGYPLSDGSGNVFRFVSVNRDVTDQKRREQTLESFHDATRRLSEADSPDDACGTAVTAGEDVLGFDHACVYRYDESTGDLRPAATSSAVGDASSLPPVAPGEGRVWQVFVEGEAFRVSEPDGRGAFGGDPSPAAELLLPLGSHGVLVLGAADGFDTEDIEAAQILAARLEAGLNHVEGERELEAREAELERQTRRAERLDRLTSVVSDVERALLEESTREGVEESVCERLVDADPYRVAWIGGSAVGAEEIAVRTRAGEDAESVDVVVDESTLETHPAGRALRSGEVVVVENVVSETSRGEWRRAALARGFQSCCAVPLAHGDRIHGVLMVYADEPDAFGERERQVFSRLGRLVGYAVTTIERRRALESDHTVELEFSVRDERLEFVAFARAADGAVEYQRTIRRPDGTASSYYTVGGAGDAADLDDALPVATVEAVSDRDGSQVVEVRADDWFGSVFTDYGAVVNAASAGDDGDDGDEGRVVVELPQQADVRGLVERFESEYDGVELLAKRETERSGWTAHELREVLETRLTDRQLEVIETAYEAGYFEWPRGSSGQDVAEMLDITQPTFNRHMRRAERVTFSLLLG